MSVVEAGDGWRWRQRLYSSAATIQVIEPAEDARKARQAQEKGRRVAFGFARALDPEPVEWLGNPS